MSTQTPNSVISLGLQQSGQGTGGAQSDLVLHTHTGSASGTGLRLLVDLDDNGITNNIRILDGGKGYAAIEALTFTHDDLDTDPLIVVPAYNFTTWNSATNFYVDSGKAGAGYVADTSYEVTNPVNSALNFKVTATAVNAGVLTTCQLASVAENNNMAFNSDYDEPYDVAGGAKIYVIKNILTITNAAGNGAFVVGDVVVDHAVATNTAVVAAIDGNDRPTSLHVIKGSFADGVQLDKPSDAAVNCTLTAITATNEAFEICGLGLDPLLNFDNDNESQGKVNVDTANVFLATDLIFYMDGRFERDSKQMMEGGITVNYTQFINVKSDLTDEADSVTDYGQSETQTHNRLIGFSNSVLRNLMFNCYNSGVVPGDATSDLPYVGQPKVNPLLNKYHSRGSLVKAGFRFNLNINSIPYFSSRIETDLRMFRELNKCHGNVYVNKGLYQAWNQARQDRWSVTLTDAAPSAQPGFTTLDSITAPTMQYEVNDRKAAIVNQGWNGISQSWLRGGSMPMMVSF